MRKEKEVLSKNLKLSKLKVIAIIVFIVMTFNLFAPTAFAIAENFSNTEAITDETTNDNTENSTSDETKIPTIIGEDISQREENVKRFWLDNGTEIAAIYLEPVHYMQDGKLVDIDNSLTEAVDDTSDQILKNKANNFNVELVKQTNPNKLATIKSKDYKINWSLANANKVRVSQSTETPELLEQDSKYKNSEKLNLKNLQSSVTYKDILNNVDIEYVVESAKIKENIILKNSDAINQNLEFTLDVGNKLKAELNENNQIVIYETNIDTPVFIMDTPYMYDSSQGQNEYSNDIKIKLEPTKKKGEYTLTIIPNKEWLKSPERVYPVTIDPTTSTSLDRSTIKDTYIYNGDTNNSTRGNAHILRIGNTKWLGPNGGASGSGNPVRSLIKFTLPTLNSGDQVIGAYLSIYNYPKTTEWTPPTRELQIDAHKITANWEEGTAYWSNTNANYTSKIEDAITYKYNSSTPNTMYEKVFNIAGMVKEWYLTGNNYGVMLKEHAEVTGYKTEGDAYFVSSDTSTTYLNARPNIIIEYRNQTGLEGYLSCHTQTAGRAGTIYTNDYNGNLTLIHPDAATPGNRLPVGISHVYNSNDKDKDIKASVVSKYGNGFMLNISTTITKQTIGSTEYAVYKDEDGTMHYFPKQGTTTTYIDEDNSGLKLTLTNNVFTMEDKDGNKQTFEKRGTSAAWGLTKIIDTSGNTNVLTFDSATPNDFVITKITDGAGVALNLAYTSGKLSSITDTAGRVTKYAYDSTGNLSTITYPDGKVTTYTYSVTLLTSAKNYDGAHIDYTYYTANVARVSTIKEYSKANELGNSLTIAYAYNVTTFTDNRGYVNNITFNDCGQAISTADFGTGTQDINNAYGQNFAYGNTGGAKNNVTQVGKLAKPVTNLLYNGNAEYDGKWSLSQWSTVAGTGAYSTEKAYVGSRSIKIVSTASVNTEPVFVQSVTIPKGKTYTFSAEMQNNIPNTASGGAVLILYYYNGAGTKITERTTQTVKNTNGAWEKMSLTFNYPADATSNVTVAIGIVDAIGTAYFDAIQLEEGAVANPFNLVENAGFNDGLTSWSKNANCTTSDDVTSDNGNNVFKIVGDITLDKSTGQTMKNSGKKGDIYNFSVWHKSNGVVKSNGSPRIAIRFIDSTGAYVAQNTQINAGSNAWEYTSTVAIADRDYVEIRILLIFFNNVNTMLFDNVSLVKDEIGNSYSYDANGNVVNTQDSAKQNSNFEYNGNNQLTKEINPKGGSFTYTYDTTVKDRLLSATSTAGQKYSFTYDSMGNATSAKVESTSSTTPYMQANAGYSSDGRYQTTATDTSDNVTTYEYNTNNGTVKSVTDPKGDKVNYTYDGMDRLINVSQTDTSKTYSNGYTYENDSLKTITHNGTTYTFNYDNWNNVKNVFVGSQNLITNNYEGNNGKLTSATYGNGQTVSYTYDRFYRMVTQAKAQGTYQYNYDARGNLAYTQDPTGTREYYFYDLIDRMTKFRNDNGLLGSYTYDENSNLSSRTFSLNGSNLNKMNYIFDKDNRLTSQTIGDGTTTTATQAVTYDSLSRPTSVKTTAGSNSYTTSYGYVNTATANKTTPLIASVTNGSNAALNYTYDKNGNIETISNGSILQQKYYYDGLNQLIREDNVAQNKIIVYNYDIGGNITSKVEYPYTTNLLDTSKTDQVTKNGVTSTYNASTQEITLNGTCTADNTCFNFNSQINILNGKPYKSMVKYVSGTISNVTSSTMLQLQVNDYTFGNFAQLQNNDFFGSVKTSTQDITYVHNNIRIDNGVILNNYKIKVMLAESTVTEYVPYTGGTLGTATSTKTYTYGNVNWRDQLTSYDGKAITYDAIGNVTSYNGNTYTWQNGRELQKMTIGTSTYSYKYNDAGIRTEKNVGGTIVKYYVEGSKIIYEQSDWNGGTFVYYQYDSSDNVIGMKYNGVQYYYIKNAQRRYYWYS
ncbi:MAG: hypothetical protein FWF46_04605 [Oscillospiraceae bacterium]|nr:hypothetical protein [Oscillospiraceae bacterium]